MKTIDKMYDAVMNLAKEAGALQKSYFRTEDFKTTTKSTDVDMLTEVDMACDHLIVDGLRALFPNDAILSEERGYQSIDAISAYTWVIDPLDGTTNFSIGHPIFAVSIARWKGDQPVFGVVYVPMLDEIYCAELGKGAYRGETRLTGSTKTSLRESVVATGFPYDRATAANNNSENVALIIPKVKGVRRLGAAAYDLCLVASGVYDAYWELRLGWWDMAAGALIITEAGGECTYDIYDGKYNLVAGAPELCSELKKIVNMTNCRK